MKFTPASASSHCELAEVGNAQIIRRPAMRFVTVRIPFRSHQHASHRSRRLEPESRIGALLMCKMVERKGPWVHVRFACRALLRPSSEAALDGRRQLGGSKGGRRFSHAIAGFEWRSCPLLHFLCMFKQLPKGWRATSWTGFSLTSLTINWMVRVCCLGKRKAKYREIRVSCHVKNAQS